MGSTRLVLLRHGETGLNKERRFRGRADPPLTPEGERQAKCAAEAVFGLAPSVLYTSPRVRARQTLVPVQTTLGLEVIVEGALDDFDYGNWTGRTPEEAAVAWPTLFATWQRDPSAAAFPAGESVRNVVERVAGFVDSVDRRHPGATVLAVTHDAIIRCAVCAVLGVPLAAYHRITVELACTTALRLDQPSLLWMNRR